MNFFEWGQAIEGYATLAIDSTACTRVLSPLSSCRKCLDICPAQALDFSANQWSANQCLGCGLCVIACPNQVFRLDEDALLEAASPDKALLVDCRHNVAPTGSDLTINCFQQLYPELIFRLLSRTQKLILYTDQTICDKCPHQWYAPGLEMQLSPFGLPTDKLILADKHTIAQHLPAQLAPSRRNFLRQIFHDTKTASQKKIVHSAQELLTDVAPSTKEAPLIPKRRLALRTLYREQLPEAIKHNELPYRRLSVDYCTFCGACANLCPTGALALRTTESEQKQLLFQPALCTQCQLCQDICLHKKMYWQDALTVEQLMDDTPIPLAYADSKTCSQCQHPYWLYPADNENAICPFCH